MRKLKKIGIGIGLSIAFLFGVLIMVSVFQTADTYSDARFAVIQSFYYDEDKEVRVAILLTNNDADYVKAHGTTTISIKTESGKEVFNSSYDFTKDDFRSWNNNFGAKFTGYVVDIPFSNAIKGTTYDVSVDIKLKDGSEWEDVKDSFYVFNF